MHEGPGRPLRVTVKMKSKLQRCQDYATLAKESYRHGAEGLETKKICFTEKSSKPRQFHSELQMAGIEIQHLVFALLNTGVALLQFYHFGKGMCTVCWTFMTHFYFIRAQ